MSDEELIAEARQEASIHDKLGDGFSEGSDERAFYYGHRDRYKRLADALEAATERFEKAEHDRLHWRRRFQTTQNRAKRAEAERDAALAAIERVRALHKLGWQQEPYGNGPDGQVLEHAVSWCLHCDMASPCDTLAALDGAHEPKAAELFPGTNAALDRLAVRKAAPANAFCVEHSMFHAVELGDPTCQFEDGFGEPVGGETDGTSD